ncbi:hypothetical protein [Bartonella bacilliformis]|nr:hypothetical protein [Bartonella bacilliformis]EKS43463.1 hypothetical protein BbINS_04337 [Bartonella bacilliformis INS]QFZ90541.1 hypothetical protein GHC17_04025 [Bartonella bacilliformis]
MEAFYCNVSLSFEKRKKQYNDFKSKNILKYNLLILLQEQTSNTKVLTLKYKPYHIDHLADEAELREDIPLYQDIKALAMNSNILFQ